MCVNYICFLYYSSQNVYSKVLLSSERHRFGPAELQFYTSFASFFIQVLASVVLVDWKRQQLSLFLVAAMLMNGAFFHFQSITEYALLEHIAPVTHRLVEANHVQCSLKLRQNTCYVICLVSPIP